MAFVELERRGTTGIITMNRPEALNALNDQVLRDLEQVLDQVEQEEEILVAVITGAGRSFVAGADIGQMSQLSAVEAKKFGVYGNQVFLKLENLTKPTIAAVNGFALGGGCELSMSCDIRIASENAVFAQPEVSLGITAGFGGTQRLARIIGVGKAKELLYTTNKIKAPEALALGLVNAVYPADQLMDEAMKLAEKIARNAPIAVRATKKAINDGLQVDMDKAIEIEEELFGSCFESQDQRNAMTAFVEKRKPDPFENK